MDLRGFGQEIKITRILRAGTIKLVGSLEMGRLRITPKVPKPSR